MNRMTRVVSLFLVAISLLSACGGSSGGSSPPPPGPLPPPPPPPPPPPVADLSGTWFVQASGTQGTCGRGFWLDGWATEVTQNADAVDFLNSDGSTFTGTVGSITVAFAGSFLEPANPLLGLVPGAVGDATITAEQLTIGANEATLFGTIDWAWLFTDATTQATCDGQSNFFLRRDGQEQDTEPNDDTPIAQPINIIANDNGQPQNSTAGWVTGSVDLVTDEFDVFQITINARSSLEVELSHFDTTTEDLDILVADTNLNLLALSDTSDSFEMLDVDLDPGTYFIAVEAFVTTAPANYILSVDLNRI